MHQSLNREEEQELKQYGEKAAVPYWILMFIPFLSLAIPTMSYFWIGSALQLIRTPLVIYFFQDLNVTAAQVDALFIIMALPWCFKVPFGVIPDSFPILSLPWKLYFIMGWLIYILANLTLVISWGRTPSTLLCM
jgi:hypothetical protein